jgi:hypothetical protein
MSEPPIFHVQGFCIRSFGAPSRSCDAEICARGIATRSGCSSYEASVHPLSYWRGQLLRLNVQPDQLDRVEKTLLRQYEAVLKRVSASPFDLQSIGFQLVDSDPLQETAS